MRVSLAYDYVDSYTQVTTWEPSVLNTLAIEEICVKPSQPITLAIRVKIEELVPSDIVTYPVGTGRGADLLGVTAELAAVQGAPFANRGVAGALSYPPAVAGIYPATGSAAGGTAVSIYGTGFTASTTFTLDGAALTSVVYVSTTQMTAVAPAGTVGLQDLVVINGNGNATLTDAFTYTAGFDAATLVSSFWYKEFSTAPWSPSASAGASLWAGDMVSYYGPQATGTLNGYTTLAFTGANNVRNTDSSLTNLFRPASGGIMFLFKVGNTPAPIGNIYGDQAIFADIGGALGLTVTSSGITAFAYSSGFSSVTKAAAVGWHVGYMSWNGTTLLLDVDSLGPSTTPCGSLYLPAGPVYFGVTYGAGPSIVGELAEAKGFQYTPTPTDYANFKSYCNTKYALSL